MKSIKKSVITLCLVLVAVAVNGADNKELDSLMNSSWRPTPAEVLSAYKGRLPNKNPHVDEFVAYRCGETGKIYRPDYISSYREKIVNILPGIIVALEAVYPDGTYFFLGRDAAYLADLVDIFYTFVGQDYRVKRLHASTATVNALYNNSGSMNQFLLSNGLDERPHAPAVIVDRTSFSHSSQSRHIYNAMTSHRSANSQSSQLIGVASTYSGNAFARLQDIPSIRSDLASSPLYISEASDFMDIGYWNSSYGSSVKPDNNGVLKGIPTQQHDMNTKNIVLALIYEGLNAIRTEKFVESVERLASSRGVAISWNKPIADVVETITNDTSQQVEEPEDTETIITSMIEDVASAVKQLGPNPAQKKYFSHNGEIIRSELESHIENMGFMKTSSNMANLLRLVSPIITDALNVARITNRDHRRLYLWLFSQIDSKDVESLKVLEVAIGESSALKDMLESKSVVFLTSERYNKQAAPVYQELVNRGVLVPKGTCEDVVAESIGA